MAKIDMLCPFTHSLCTECALYRGRHYHLGSCKKYGGYIGKLKEDTKPDTDNHSVDLLTLKNYVEPWANGGCKSEIDLDFRLKVVDIVTEETRTCSLEEARGWDWSDPETVRIIGHLQVTNWDKLVEIARFKASNGHREVEIYEGPHIMLIGGG